MPGTAGVHRLSEMPRRSPQRVPHRYTRDARRGSHPRTPGCLLRRASVPGRACRLLWATGAANRLVDVMSRFSPKTLPPTATSAAGSPSCPRTCPDSGAWSAEGGSDRLGHRGLLVLSRRAQSIAQRDQYGS